MSYILIHPLETSSHINSVLKVAKALQSRGYTVVFLIFTLKYQSIFKTEGFQYFILETNILINVPRNKFDIRYFFTALYHKRAFIRDFLNCSIYELALLKFKPSLVIIDLSLNYYSFLLWKKQIPFMIFCTKVSLNYDLNVPPFTSGNLAEFDNFTLIHKFRNYLLWQYTFTKQFFLHLVDFLSVTSLSPLYLVIRFCVKHSIPFIKLINFNRCTHFGWKHIPEIILSPKSFDFIRDFSPNQVHMGPTVDMNRVLTVVHQKFIDEINFIINSKKDKFVIFCSFGSYDEDYSKIRIKFFNILISLINKRNDVVLILSLGKGVKILNPNLINVFLFNDVPQLDLLKHTDLMINHGGMQSVTECILSEVPMLVFPLNPKLDQNGNAARVVYHKIGLRGNLKRDKPKVIEDKINKLLCNKDYYVNNIKHLKREMLDSGDFDKGIKFIESYMQRHSSIHEQV